MAPTNKAGGKRSFDNPFKPGAGHMPPYLAGRDDEQDEFRRLLNQTTILDNAVITGLRGVGKTVLLETLKPIALQSGWLWSQADLSESMSVNESTVVIRLLTDLSVVVSPIVIGQMEQRSAGFAPPQSVERRMDFNTLIAVYEGTPGLTADKLKAVLEFVWEHLKKTGAKGIVFAYDEAQTLSDHAAKDQYPLSLILDVFQSIQRKGIPFMLVLAGLPTLFPKLVEARTFSERMFHVLTLDKLSEKNTKEAIAKPIEKAGCPVHFNELYVDSICKISGGYPYFIQFICREAFDVAITKIDSGQPLIVPVRDVVRKLDADFFAGRWSRATDRQRQLMQVIATLDHCDEEFSVQDIVDASKNAIDKPFGNSHVNQMLNSLMAAGLIFKNRYGKYSFAVPLLGQYIRRQFEESTTTLRGA